MFCEDAFLGFEGKKGRDFMYNDNDSFNAKRIILTKLTYERCKSYISNARVIMHLHRGEEFDDGMAFKNLWHILDLISHDLDVLDNTLENKMSITLNNELEEEITTCTACNNP